MLRRLLSALAAVAVLIAAANPCHAQIYFPTPNASVNAPGTQIMCPNGSSQAVPCSAATPLAVTGSVTPVPNLDTAALITHVAASVGVNGADQSNLSGHGINVVVNITAITGTTPTLTITLQGKDAASGVYYTILTSAALAATGTTVLTVFPGAAVTANVSANAILPKTWRVISTIAGTTPAVTATVGASVIE